MAINWDLYNKRLNVNGDTKRDRDLNCLQNKITNNLPNSLSCKAVKINGVDGSLNFTETKTGYDIQSLPNEIFSVGDYVTYKTLTYLITKVNGDDEVYTKGSMEQCNFTLKFQSTDGTILSYPCITDNRVQGTGDTDTKVMTLPAGRKIILLPHDENTTLLRNDRRLFVDLHPTDPRPYEIDFVDSTKFNYGDKGLLEIYVTEDTLQSDDRVDLGVCNYFEPTVEPEPPIEGYSVIVTTSGDLIAGSSYTRTFIPILKDNTGTVVEFTTTPTWTFDYGTMSHTDFTITYSGNNCLIKVAENYDILGMTLRVICTTADGLYSGYTDVFITTM